MITYPFTDFSLGVQKASTWLLKKPNALERGVNVNFTKIVGAATRKDGNVAAGSQFSTIPNLPTGAHVAKYTTGNVRFVAVNNDGGTATIIRTQNIGTGAWTTLAGITYPINSVIFFIDYLDEVYISGFDPATSDPVQPYNVDKTLDVSSTRNLLYMPPGYFLIEYLGILYSCNVKLGSVRYADRFYKASPPLGYMTTVQGAQTDVYPTTTLVNNVPTMTSNTTPVGVALASNEASAAFAAWKAFNDTNAGTDEWSTAALTSGTLQYDFGASNARTITYYAVTGPALAETALNMAPKTWTFEGSNNGASWTTIDARTNVPTWVAGERRVYAVTNTTAYRYYRLNITANQGGANLLVAQFELLTSTGTSKDLQVKLDSVRYVKVGMTIDIYGGGTNTKKYTIQPNTVDKVNNIITFTPYTNQFAASTVTVAADTITLTGLGTLYPTGTPVRFQTNNTLPAPLLADTTYYSIYVDANTIKVATTAMNAQGSIAIDLTTQGTGPHYVLYSYVLADNDELWLTGRKDKLTVFWNVDYPTPEATGEWFALRPGADSSNAITGARQSSGRLFIWGKNSGTKWDGQQLKVFNNSVGCISHNSIQNIDDDWLIWLDAKGRVWARNETSGQQEMISKPMRDYLKQLTSVQLKATSASIAENTYQLYLGTINGENIRITYDFDANLWAPERLNVPALISMGTDDSTGTLLPNFASNDGYVYADGIGNTDGGKTISFEMGTGRDMLGTAQMKKIKKVLIFSSNASGLKLECAVDGGQFKTLGEIQGKVCMIELSEQGDNALRRGVTFDFQVMSNIPGDPPSIEAMIVYLSPEGDKRAQ